MNIENQHTGMWTLCPWQSSPTIALWNVATLSCSSGDNMKRDFLSCLSQEDVLYTHLTEQCILCQVEITNHLVTREPLFKRCKQIDYDDWFDLYWYWIPYILALACQLIWYESRLHWPECQKVRTKATSDRRYESRLHWPECQKVRTKATSDRRYESRLHWPESQKVRTKATSDRRRAWHLLRFKATWHQRS